ncbi:hypothetical protein Pmani_035607 [Petrolisthes manimaculis]|uniref:Uncharacterized protein n=1 Tax=Petrolisthes manimaculis TaxID=1843537 RepID=A0AAE1TQC6_9EUCA|nr:hypothetical protein Pmani_035607 [Petrolisthes manimaculis]
MKYKGGTTSTKKTGESVKVAGPKVRQNSEEFNQEQFLAYTCEIFRRLLFLARLNENESGRVSTIHITNNHSLYLLFYHVTTMATTS